mmetsp:Transcript_28356/g.61903  ORF Transcript_28356/g.61903 Transcript_28356/m.61903 type:complete len:171 (+) Transcript_28356:3-515(+)
MTTSLAAPSDVIVTGSLTMNVSNPAAFIADPKVKLAIAVAMAKKAGVASSRVIVTLSLQEGRRLDNHLEGGSASGEVLVSYRITVPASSASSAQTIREDLSATSPEAMTTLIVEAMAEEGISESYTVAVLVISAEIETPTTTNAGLGDVDEATQHSLGLIVCLITLANSL